MTAGIHDNFYYHQEEMDEKIVGSLMTRREVCEILCGTAFALVFFKLRTTC